MNEKAERKTLKDLQKEIYIFKTEKLMTLHTYMAATWQSKISHMQSMFSFVVHYAACKI